MDYFKKKELYEKNYNHPGEFRDFSSNQVIIRHELSQKCEFLMKYLMDDIKSIKKVEKETMEKHVNTLKNYIDRLAETKGKNTAEEIELSNYAQEVYPKIYDILVNAQKHDVLYTQEQMQEAYDLLYKLNEKTKVITNNIRRNRSAYEDRIKLEKAQKTREKIKLEEFYDIFLGYINDKKIYKPTYTENGVKQTSGKEEFAMKEADVYHVLLYTPQNLLEKALTETKKKMSVGDFDKQWKIVRDDFLNSPQPMYVATNPSGRAEMEQNIQENFDKELAAAREKVGKLNIVDKDLENLIELLKNFNVTDKYAPSIPEEEMNEMMKIADKISNYVIYGKSVMEYVDAYNNAHNDIQREAVLRDLKSLIEQNVFEIIGAGQFREKEFVEMTYDVLIVKLKEMGIDLTEKKQGKDKPIIDPTDPDLEPEIKRLIEAIRRLISKVTLQITDDALKAIMDGVEKLLQELYELEFNKFLEKLSNAKTVEEKLDLIEKFEKRFEYYTEILTHPDKEIDKRIAPHREEMIGKIKDSYNNSKRNGEYTWANSEAVKESREYIYGQTKETDRFEELKNKMYDVIANPSQEKHDEWQKEMQEYATQNSLDPDKMIPYLTACAKLKNNNLSVTKEFEIHGLNLNKKRQKVTSVTKEPGFFKRHPKLKILAIGLAILLGSHLGLSALMMINSSAWGVLGGTGPVCNALHSINMALSKVVGFGAFKFVNAGTYNLGGQAGALPLYSAVGAKLTSAAIGLGGIGALVANKIKNGKFIGRKPIIGPLNEEETHLVQGVSNEGIVDNNRRLFIPNDANERERERAEKYINKKGLNEGIYVVNTKAARNALKQRIVKQEAPVQQETPAPISQNPEVKMQELIERLEKLENTVATQQQQLSNAFEEFKSIGYKDEDIIKIMTGQQVKKPEPNEGMTL